MTINELYIQLDIHLDNKISILKGASRKCDEGYLFVDSSDGYCYLFDENGNEDNAKKIKKIKARTFAFYENLKSIVIPDSAERIGKWVFWACENLKSIIIPDSVKSIGDGAFYNCKSLKSIIIPDSVKSIGYNALIYCESLKSIIFKGKTMKQVKEMKNYPFGIKDELIIKCI